MALKSLRLLTTVMANKHNPGTQINVDTTLDSDMRFRTLFEQAPFSIQLMNAEGRTIMVNQAWESLWQVRDGDGIKEYVLSGEYNVLHDPQLEAKGIALYLRRAFAGESVDIPPVYYDPAEIGKPGRARLVKAHARPIVSEDGAVREVMLMHEDITERGETEDALRISEERLRLATEAGKIGIWDWDTINNKVVWSDEVYILHGLKPDQFNGRVEDIQFLIHPDERADFLTKLEHALQSETRFSTDFRGLLPNGTERWFSTSAQIKRAADGTVVRMIGATVDITTRKHTENALRENERRLRELANSIPQLAWVADAEGWIHWYNDRWYAYTGTTPADMEGWGWQSVHDPETLPAVMERWTRSIASGEAFQMTFPLRGADGTYRPFFTLVSPLRDSAGNISQWFGTNTDVSPLQEAEQKLLAAIEKLTQADRRKDEFLAMLAHELRNPLAPISVAAQVLKMPTNDDERVRQTSDIILRQVKHMTSLIDDLLDVSRVTRGLVTLNKEVVDLKLVVNRAFEQVRPLLESRHHRLTLKIGAEPAFVYGDQVRLVQVIGNLLNNAAKFTQPGGEITIATEVSGRLVNLCVTDNGIGIEPELLPHVFELFSQGKRNPDRSQGGLGLGLALVRSLMSLHGGSVTVDSGGAGHGSRFTITLPLTAARQEGNADADDSMPHATRPLRVMVVDDNVDAAQTLATFLSVAGHQPRAEHHADAALATAAAFLPQVCILDIGLPDVDGYELARRLRAQRQGNPMLMLALTGYGQANDRALSKEAGFDHHFVKPVDITLLLQTLATQH